MGKGHARWVAMAVLALVSITSAVGRAQDTSEESSAIREAQQRFTLAEEHFERGEHALALAEFERVLALMEAEGHANAPLVLYNIGVVNERMDRERAALDAYERFSRRGAARCGALRGRAAHGPRAAAATGLARGRFV